MAVDAPHAGTSRPRRVATASRVSGPEALPGVLAQLEGFEAPAGMWESDVLAARVKDIRSNLVNGAQEAHAAFTGRLVEVVDTLAERGRELHCGLSALIAIAVAAGDVRLGDAVKRHQQMGAATVQAPMIADTGGERADLIRLGVVAGDVAQLGQRAPRA